MCRETGVVEGVIVVVIVGVIIVVVENAISALTEVLHSCWGTREGNGALLCVWRDGMMTPLSKEMVLLRLGAVDNNRVIL